MFDIKFVNLFAAMAVGPTLGLVVITSLFFNLEFRTWYGGAVKNAVVNSNIVARDYENEIQAEIISDTQLIMREIIKVSRNNEVNINAINQGRKRLVSSFFRAKFDRLNRIVKILLFVQRDLIGYLILPHSFCRSYLFVG